MLEDKQEMFDVIEPVDVGNLDDVKEESRPLMRPTKNVKVAIKRVSARQNKEGDNPAGSYRWLNLGVQIVDGVEVDGEVKYKGMYVNTENMCYYADPQYYPKSTGEQKGLFFGRFADLRRATETAGMKVDDTFIEVLKGKIVLCDIAQGKDGKGEAINIAKMFKAVPLDQQV